MDLKQEENHGLRETVGTLEQEILEARREVGEAERKLEESRLRVAAMTASLSWRATRPARAAKRVLGRLRPAWKPLVLTVLGVALAAIGTAGLLGLALVG